MITGYLLTIVLTTTIGNTVDRAVFEGKKPYPSMSACIEAGLKTMNWLSQDFVKLSGKCTPMDGSFSVEVWRGVPA